MPIIFQGGATAAQQQMTTTAGSIENCVSQDVRQVLNPNAGLTQLVDAALLLDYVGRISYQILRFKNWKFLQSAPQLFITQPGVTDYWVGAAGAAPIGCVDTGLNLTDIQSIKKDMFFNRSVQRALAQTADPPLTLSLQQPSRPLLWRNAPDTPYVLNVYPPSDANAAEPALAPGGPVVQFVPGGALPLRTYYVRTSFVDTAGGESTTSLESFFVVPAGQLISVQSPVLTIAGASGVVNVTTASGVLIGQWNVYISQAPGAQDLAAPSNNQEVRQNASPIPIGTNWTEPTSGLVAGAQFPASSTLALLQGYVVEFRYFKVRQPITNPNQILQIPDFYKDIVCAGVNWLAYKYLKKDDEAQVWAQVYQKGLTEMVKDSNLFPRAGEFVRPDMAGVAIGNLNTGVGLDSGQESSLP